MIDKLLKGKDVYIINVPKSHENIKSTYHKEGLKDHDAVVSFSFNLDDMVNHVNQAISLLKDGGMLYLYYPKLKNRLDLDGIHRDHIFPKLHVDMDTDYIKNTLMRFNMMRSLDDNYTILGIKKDESKEKGQRFLVV